MAQSAILEALKELKAEKSEVRDALNKRAERLANEQKVQTKPGAIRDAIYEAIKKA